eukprot:CAMPEP_0197024856 /NCGR_PEP_ID=MMETSP1384-20130603/5334_1 /TAXON_ID=29189 /ORGANISM="Ammonia sp." /LENGTH=655 /DNA_ID=CAMNT_0042453313 /DNA_START=54 /DNA_END=2021 /DNA_ORIENTATION=-
MADLPVSRDELKQTIQDILDSGDLSSITASTLRSTLETKFNLNEGDLSAHRDVISSLMDECINSSLKQTDMDDLDRYLAETVEDDDDAEEDSEQLMDSNHNNKNKNKNQAKSNNSKSKSRASNKHEMEIMDINYSDPSNSKLYHLFVDDNNIKYSIMLNQTDISYNVRGHNKFYAIQLLEHKQRGQYKLVCKWGRVGAKAQKSEQVFDAQSTAVAAFKKKFRDKTKNEWGTPRFQAVKGKYIPIGLQTNEESPDVDIDIDDNPDDDDDDDEKEEPVDDGEQDGNGMEQDDEEMADNQEVPDSQLEAALIRILKLIFSKQLQCDTAKEFDFDLHRMPLGQLSTSQINKGYNVLCKLNDVLVDQSQRNNMNKVSQLTSKYYTIIPHNFGHALPPIINTLKRLHREIELIETLKQMIFTNKILKKRNRKKNPIDVHYQALRCDITPLPRFSTEYEMIAKSIKQTHASTHNEYELEIMDIFEMNRVNSKIRHMPFERQLANKKLLWHGSRLSNFVGILSQGLRIAPPEAPTTGYMFGKGVYFADSASKSANYIHATEQHPFGLLILCEVALGNEYPLVKAKYLDRAPNGYHSTKGVGKTIPDEANKHDIDGYELYLGPLTENQDVNVQQNGNLLYNEYVVYDIGQVRMKYLVLTRFDFT